MPLWAPSKSWSKLQGWGVRFSVLWFITFSSENLTVGYMPPFLSPWSRLDLGEKKVFKWPSKSRWLQQLLSTSRSDLSGGVSKTCAKCHLWNMLVYVHKKRKARFLFHFILVQYLPLGFSERFGLLFKNMWKLPSFTKGQEPAALLSQGIWMKGSCQEFQP